MNALHVTAFSKDQMLHSRTQGRALLPLIPFYPRQGWRGIALLSCLLLGVALQWTAIAYGDEPPIAIRLTDSATTTARTSQPSTSSERSGVTSSSAPTPTAGLAAADAEAEKNALRQRQQQIAIGLFLLVGIALAWMIGFALLWGWRTRRLVRQPLPPAPRGDELWYLKNPMPPSPPANQPDRTNHPTPPEVPPAARDQLQ